MSSNTITIAKAGGLFINVKTLELRLMIVHSISVRTAIVRTVTFRVVSIIHTLTNKHRYQGNKYYIHDNINDKS